MSTTKIHRIVAMDICQSHPNKKAYQTDAYYAKLANQFGFTPCIADPANPYYDAAVARKEAIKM